MKKIMSLSDLLLSIGLKPSTHKPRPDFRSFENLLIPKQYEKKGLCDLNALLKNLSLKPSNRSKIKNDIYGNSTRPLNNHGYQEHSQKTMSDILIFIEYHQMTSKEQQKKELRNAFENFYIDSKANCAQVLLKAIQDLKIKVMAIFLEYHSGETALLTKFSVLASLTLSEAIQTQVTRITSREINICKKKRAGIDQHVVAIPLADAAGTLNLNKVLGIQKTDVMTRISDLRSRSMKLAWNKLYDHHIYDDWCTTLLIRCRNSDIQRDILQALHPDGDFEQSKYIDQEGFININAILEIMKNHTKILRTTAPPPPQKPETKIIAGIYLQDTTLLNEGLSDQTVTNDTLLKILQTENYYIDSGNGPLAISAIDYMYGTRSRPIVTTFLNGFTARGLNPAQCIPEKDKSKLTGFLFLSDNPIPMINLLTNPFNVKETIQVINVYINKCLFSVKDTFLIKLAEIHPNAFNLILKEIENNRKEKRILHTKNKDLFEKLLLSSIQSGFHECQTYLLTENQEMYDSELLTKALNETIESTALTTIRKLKPKERKLKPKVLRETMFQYKKTFFNIYKKLFEIGQKLNFKHIAIQALKKGNYGIILAILDSLSDDISTKRYVFDLAMNTAIKHKDTLAIALLIEQG